MKKAAAGPEPGTQGGSLRTICLTSVPLSRNKVYSGFSGANIDSLPGGAMNGYIGNYLRLATICILQQLQRWIRNEQANDLHDFGHLG